MKLKIAVFVALTMIFAACGNSETVKKEDKSKETKIETSDGKKIEIKEDGVKVKDGDKEITVSKDGVSVKDKDKKDDEDPKDGDKANVDDGKLAEKLTLKGINETKTFACEGRRIIANGTGNSYTFTGECAAVLVNGTGQTITVEKVGRINVNGTGNKIIYSEGLDGKEPKISNAGTGNSVNKK